VLVDLPRPLAQVLLERFHAHVRHLPLLE
jgi:hypothetical protein